MLSFIDQLGITGSYNDALGILDLTGAANVSAYQQALRAICYENLSNKPTTGDRTISFVANDGEGNSAAVTKAISIIPVNDAPELGASGSSITYTENNPAVIVDSGLSITDDSDSFTNATVAISLNFNAIEDALSFTNKNNIIGSYNNITGILTLTGSDTIAHYQTALRSVTYENLSIIHQQIHAALHSKSAMVNLIVILFLRTSIL